MWSTGTCRAQLLSPTSGLSLTPPPLMQQRGGSRSLEYTKLFRAPWTLHWPSRELECPFLHPSPSSLSHPCQAPLLPFFLSISLFYSHQLSCLQFYTYLHGDFFVPFMDHRIGTNPIPQFRSTTIYGPCQPIIFLTFILHHFFHSPPPSPYSLTLVHFKGVSSIFPTCINLYKHTCACTHAHSILFVF